jgi:hypothetical protein
MISSRFDSNEQSTQEKGHWPELFSDTTLEISQRSLPEFLSFRCFALETGDDVSKIKTIFNY